MSLAVYYRMMQRDAVCCSVLQKMIYICVCVCVYVCVAFTTQHVQSSPHTYEYVLTHMNTSSHIRIDMFVFRVHFECMIKYQLNEKFVEPLHSKSCLATHHEVKGVMKMHSKS